jgi:hypothetical protein
MPRRFPPAIPLSLALLLVALVCFALSGAGIVPHAPTAQACWTGYVPLSGPLVPACVPGVLVPAGP